jgi:hypothetical protein
MIGLIAQAPVPVRIVNESGPAWTEIAGVVVTLAAVFVALFAVPIRERLKRPKLALSPGSEALGVVVGLDPIVMTLRLHNARGRDTAREVEVFVTVLSEGTPATYIVAEEANLNFDDPLPRVVNPGGKIGIAKSEPGRSTATVPSGFARNVNFAVIGIQREGGKLGDAWGYLALYPPRVAQDATLFFHMFSYHAWIVVTGSNFDAITYEGKLKVTEEDEPDDKGGYVRTRTLHWTIPPVRTDNSPIRPPLGIRWRRG